MAAQDSSCFERVILLRGFRSTAFQNHFLSAQMLRMCSCCHRRRSSSCVVGLLTVRLTKAPWGLRKTYRSFLAGVCLLGGILADPPNGRRAHAHFLRDLTPRESLRSKLNRLISPKYGRWSANGPSAVCPYCRARTIPARTRSEIRTRSCVARLARRLMITSRKGPALSIHGSVRLRQRIPKPSSSSRYLSVARVPSLVRRSRPKQQVELPCGRVS